MLQALVLALLGVGRGLAVDADFALASIFSNGMILQRDSSSTVLWGFGKSGSTVDTLFAGKHLTTTVDSEGVWRQHLPPTPAGGPKGILFQSEGKELALEDVRFGDVFLCSGQSNMRFGIQRTFNSAVELSRVHDYASLIRVTTVTMTSSDTPLSDVPPGTNSKPPVWEPPTKPSFGYYSAVCWFFGRNIADALGRNVPIGLVLSAYPSSQIQAWAPRGFEGHCDPSTFPVQRVPVPLAVLWNAMIAPLTVGPLALKGIVWYQGESDRRKPDFYACAFPALIDAWRAAFGSPDLYFGFVVVSPCGGDARMRDAQMAAAALPRVGYATAEDYGDYESPYMCLHPRNKQAPAARLTLSALDIAYGRKDVAQWRQPTLSAARGSVDPETCDWEVTVSFTPESLGGGGVVVNEGAPPARCPAGFPPDRCVHPTVVGSDGSVHAASVAATPAGDELVFRVPRAGARRGVAVPARVMYAYNIDPNATWPLYSLFSTHLVTTRFDKVAIPVRGFNASVTLVPSDSSAAAASSGGCRGAEDAEEGESAVPQLPASASNSRDRPSLPPPPRGGRSRASSAVRGRGSTADAQPSHDEFAASRPAPRKQQQHWLRKSDAFKLLVGSVALLALCLLPAAWTSAAAKRAQGVWRFWSLRLGLGAGRRALQATAAATAGDGTITLPELSASGQLDDPASLKAP